MKVIGVIGAGECDPALYEAAREVGRLIAKRGAALVCGGLFGVMEAASQGAKEAGGLTVGLLPGADPGSGNPYLDLALPTGLGEGRNLLIVRAAEALIAIGGGYGTLSEIALALKTGKRVVGLQCTWGHIPGIVKANSPEEAVERAMAP